MVAVTLLWMRRVGRTRMLVWVMVTGENMRAVTSVFLLSKGITGTMGRHKGRIERRFRHEMIQGRS